MAESKVKPTGGTEPAQDAPKSTTPPVAEAPKVLELKNKETAAQFECLVNFDFYVHQPGFKRMLVSEATPELAAKLVEVGHRAFKRKA